MNEFLGFGVAGNFANHLQQAGEFKDFANMQTEEANAPVGIFPFYIPNSGTILGRYCFNNQNIILPPNPDFNVQAEPEVALECDLEYKDGKVTKITPKYFMAFNDTSVRNDKNAKKLSQKKNFSEGSKAMGQKIPIDTFSTGGICDNYSLASFIIIDEKVQDYGESSELIGYSYFYEKLIEWIKNKLNTQEEFSVLENMQEVLKEAKYPKKALIAVGATRYTHLAETRFLKKGDTICIVVYNHKKYTLDEIKDIITQKCITSDIQEISLVRQVVK